MNPSSHSVFETIISKPRLDSYRKYFHTRTPDEAIGLYMWNSEVSTCFSSLMAFFEIALRNSIHRSMSLHYSSGTSSSIHWYDTIWAQLKHGSKAKINDVRHKQTNAGPVLIVPPPTPDEIVSRVSFGFWPNVLGTVNPAHADKIFPVIFPFHPLSATPLDWSVKARRRQALAFIYELNDFRNRIAHHEPLWKFSAIKDTAATPPVVLVPESLNQTDSLNRFSRLIALFDAGVAAMDQTFHQDLMNSTWRYRLSYLLSNRGIERYRSCKHYPISTKSTPTEFKRNFSLVVKQNRPVVVSKSSSRGLFIPE